MQISNMAYMGVESLVRLTERHPDFQASMHLMAKH